MVPVVVVRPKLSVREVVETRSRPMVPVVVVRPKLSVRVVVETRCPSQVPLVVVRPKLSVLEVVLQAALAVGATVANPATSNSVASIDDVSFLLVMEEG